MNEEVIARRIIELKTQYIFLLNRDRPKGYQREIKRVQQQILKLKRKYALTKIYIRIVRVSLPYLAAIITRFPYTRRRSRFLDRLVVLSEESEE